MMVCLYQNFFNSLYDYFQTGLINYICMSQLYSQTKDFLCFPHFFPKSPGHTASSWLPGRVRSRTRDCTSLLAGEPLCIAVQGSTSSLGTGCRTGNLAAEGSVLWACFSVQALAEASFHPLPF